MTKNKLLRLVPPNAGIAAWYRRKLRELLAAMHESLTLHILAAYKNADFAIGFAQDDSSAVVTMKRAMSRWGSEWITRFDRMSADIAKQFAHRTARATDRSMMAALKSAGFTVKFQPTKASIEAYRAVLAENVNLIRSIPQQYLKDVETQVWSAVMEGGTTSKLTAGLQKRYGISYRRAAFIATDQQAKAKAIMENVRRQELGITEAIWHHSHAGREPRPTHVAMHGKKFALKSGMWDSAVGKFVWPGQLPRCRCSSKAILPGIGE